MDVITTFWHLRSLVMPRMPPVDCLHVYVAFSPSVVPRKLAVTVCKQFLDDMDQAVQHRYTMQPCIRSKCFSDLLLFQSELRGLIKDIKSELDPYEFGTTWYYERKTFNANADSDDDVDDIEEISHDTEFYDALLSADNVWDMISQFGYPD